MKKTDGFEFLELFGEIDDKYIEQSFLPWKSRKIFRITYLRNIAACLILIIIIAMTCLFPNQVKGTLKSFQTVIERIFGFRQNISDYTDIVGKSVTKNGITITLDEVVLSNEEMLVSYTIITKNQDDLMLLSEAWINDHRIVTSEEYAEYNEKNSSNLNKVICYRFDKNWIVDDKAQIKIKLEPELENGKKIGKFNFQFEASKEALMNNIISVPINRIITINENIKMSLTEFNFNPIESNIKGICDNLPSEMSGYTVSYRLKGKDNLGNYISYRLNNYTKPNVNFVIDKRKNGLNEDSSWIELQLYAVCLEPNEGDGETIVDDLDSLDDSNTDMNFNIEEMGIDHPFEPFALGEKIRIQIKGRVENK